MSEFSTPTQEDVAAALRRIPTLQLRRVFYEGLQNPNWVVPLAKAGAFSAPPEPEPTEDGYIRDIYWPELSYLTRVAPLRPREVVDIFLSLRESNNAWVRRAVFEVGSQIPASEGVRLRPLLESWKTTGFGWRTDPRELVSFAVALLNGGERKTGRWLTNLLFEPRAPHTEEASKKPYVELEDYWYQEELPRVLTALGDDALKAVTGWLVKHTNLSGSSKTGSDFSGMVRPSIRSRGDEYPDIEHALIDAVRDLALPAMLLEPELTTNVLLRPGVQLLRKIAMYVVGEALRVRIDAGEDAGPLTPVAKRLLADPAADDSYLRVEYAELAQALAKVDADGLDAINGFIAAAYLEDLRWMRERLTEEDSSDDESEAQIVERADQYKHHWLSAIGAAALPPQLRDELASLDSRFGAIEDALTPSGVITTWTGPNPYLSQDDMAVMSAPELVGELSSWHDTGNGWGPGPSHEGQGREVSALLTTNPLALSGVDYLADRLRPTYLRAILQGWEAALKADLDLDWAQVADLIRAVLGHEDASPFPAEGRDFDDDKDFRGAKSAAVGLLGELVTVRKSLEVPGDMVQQFAELLIQEAQDEVAWTEYNNFDPGESTWDPLTLSLNWQWPERLRGLLRLATRDEDASWKPAALRAIEAELERPDRHGAGRAVLGEHLGRMYNHAYDWLMARAEDFFGSDHTVSTQQQVALTTAMAMHYYHRDLYDLLASPMRGAIAIGDGVKSGWRSDSNPIQRIGEWAIDAIVFGHVTLEDPVVKAFFSEASATVRGGAIGKIAWSFFRADEVDDAIRDRFATFLDQRIAHVQVYPDESAELSGLYWIAKGEKFPVAFWLPRLRQALELEPSIAKERYMIGPELAKASSVDPHNAFAVLRTLTAGRSEAGMAASDLSRHAVPMVIANAMSAGDDELRREAHRYMNELGAQGNLGVEEEVNAILDGRVTANDLDEA